LSHSPLTNVYYIYLKDIMSMKKERLMRFEIGFVGAGNMGGAIINNVFQNKHLVNLDSNNIIICDTDLNKLSYYESLGFNTTTNIDDVLNKANITFFAIKPQTFSQLSFSNKSILSQYIVSIMAGVSIAKIREVTNFNGPIIRAMPNLPCLDGNGTIGITYPNTCNRQEMNLINSIFNVCGETIEIPEHQFDALTSISGSGPAYVFYFLKSLIDAGVDVGLTQEISSKLVFNTFLGSTLFAINSKDSLEELITKVSSKGGTTVEAINVFRTENLDEIILNGVKACAARSKQLSEVKQ